MTNWTEEQRKAINLEGNNIIVSAGAGSGKTAVLSERVLRKLKDGINIDRLLILTFTKEASLEMKNRIRKKIEDNNLVEQLNYIDSSYITTFDSFAFSIVKKYHYLLNISDKINIVDSNIIDSLKNKILNTLFENLYQEKNSYFLKLIGDFCVKDDTLIKKEIKNISMKLDLKYDKEIYLNNYINNYFNEDYVNNLIISYENILLKIIKSIKEKYNLLESFCSEQYYEQITESLNKLLNSTNYDEIKSNINITLPKVYKNMDVEGKKIKNEIDEYKKSILKLLTYSDKSEIKETLISTKDYIKIIIDIIKELDHQINDYKDKFGIYEYIDISKMAIKIVSENKEIRDELKYFYNEILVDEYQDTNDLQEMFISLISNNNVYMVGDIKQSIYRFRNANPLIFKNKYDLYNNDSNGIKIDLLKNFRSRKEVIDSINLIFSFIMDDFLGGANYKQNHKMLFGNVNYEKNGKTNQNNNLEIYNYFNDEQFSKEEIEAFIIANDIKEKVENNYQIFDSEKQILRNIAYSDICIIMDRKNAFIIYKQIFEYLGIPLAIYADETLTTGDEILIIRNIIKFILKINNRNFDKEFKYCYVSIARSFIKDYKDNDIFKNIKNNTIYESDIFLISKEISDKLYYLSPLEILNLIIEKFNIYEKLVTIGNVENAMIRIESLQNICKEVENLNWTISMFSEYLNEVIDNDFKIRYSLNTKYGNNVKIMTIHKSKGLEFNLCYYSGLYKEFNIQELNDKFFFKSEFGIITPYYKKGIGITITKELVKEKYIQEEISEQIRLFYVALTRCKEKMIIIANLDEDNDEYKNSVIENNIRIKYKSFLDMLKSIKTNLKTYTKNINLDNINTIKNYKIKNTSLYECNNYNEKIIVKENDIKEELIQNKHASKTIKTLITKEDALNMNYGSYIHYLFEVTDFYNPKVPKEYDKIIKKFLDAIDLNNTKIYKEYEFVYEKNGVEYNGIIDLILEYEDNIKIIDYKLKNINDKTYIKQLEIYKNYLKIKTNKPIFTYFYSILDEKLVEIKM